MNENVASLLYIESLHLRSLIRNSLNEKGQIRSKKFHRDCKQYYSEELLHEIHSRFTQHTLYAPRCHQNNIHNHHIRAQSKQNIQSRIFGPEREKRCKRAGTGKQRKDKRDKSRIIGKMRCILKNLNIEHHFQRHKEYNNRTGNSKRVYINAKEVQYPVSHKEKEKH